MMAYVDSSIWICRFEGHPPFQKAIEYHFRQLEKEGWTLCVSETVILEVLFKPYCKKQTDLLTLYHNMFAQIDILPNYSELFQDALSLSIKENLRALDSIHMAFATHYKCDRFISSDHHFKKLKTITPLWIDLSGIF